MYVTTGTISGIFVSLADLVCELLIISFSIPLAAHFSVTWGRVGGVCDPSTWVSWQFVIDDEIIALFFTITQKFGSIKQFHLYSLAM